MLNQYKYDVALSFSGKDRETARKLAFALQRRGIKVYYDEWAKAEIWGKDLLLHLHEIYSANARFCVPLLSNSYVSGKWTKHELQSAQERSLRMEEEYILPIRLDDAIIPGLHTTIAYIDYGKSDEEEVAQLISQKLQFGLEGAIVPEAVPKSTIEIIPTKVEGFTRSIITADVRILEPEIMNRIEDIYSNTSNKLRYAFARDLGRYFRFKSRLGFGPIYTAWRIYNRVFLSTLPQVGYEDYEPQTTFEFEIYGDSSKKLSLLAAWVASDTTWAPIPPIEFQLNVKGISADRSGCDMTRESTIRVLEERGAHFKFPVAPNDGEPEKFCEWLGFEPQGIFLDWDRNPRLVEPNIGVWKAIYHEETGEGILLFTIHGAWSNNALYNFEDALDQLLPKRYIRTPFHSGLMRICVHLSNTPPKSVESDKIDEYNFDFKYVWPAVERIYAAIGRMVAAQREIPLNSPNPEFGLPKPDNFHYYRFEKAVQSIGVAEHPKKVKDHTYDSDELGWVILRHSPYCGRIAVTSSIEGFDFSKTVTKEDLISYIERCERY